MFYTIKFAYYKKPEYIDISDISYANRLCIIRTYDNLENPIDEKIFDDIGCAREYCDYSENNGYKFIR